MPWVTCYGKPDLYPAGLLQIKSSWLYLFFFLFCILFRNWFCLCTHVAIVSIVALVISCFNLPLLFKGTSNSVCGAVSHTCASACRRFRRCWCLADDGPNSKKLRCAQQALPHSRKRRVQELVHLCSKLAVERRHLTVINPKKSRDHPIFVCCSKANRLSSRIVGSFKIFRTLSS